MIFGCAVGPINMPLLAELNCARTICLRRRRLRHPRAKSSSHFRSNRRRQRKQSEPTRAKLIFATVRTAYCLLTPIDVWERPAGALFIPLFPPFPPVGG